MRSSRAITSIQSLNWFPILAIVIGSVFIGLGLSQGVNAVSLFLFLSIPALFLILLVLRMPEVGFLLAVFLFMFDSQSIPGPISISLSNLFLLMTCAAIFFKRVIQGVRTTHEKISHMDRPSLILSAGLLIAALLSIADAEYPDVVLRQMITLFGGLLVLVLPHLLYASSMSWDKLTKSYVIGATICAFIGILQSLLARLGGISLGILYTHELATELPFPRVTSTWLDPNIFGLYIATAVPLVSALFDKNRFRVLFWTILAFGLFVTYSRTAWVSLAVGIWTLWVLWMLKPANRKIDQQVVVKMLIISVITVMLVYGVWQLGIWDALVNLNADAVEGRIDMSMIGLEYFLNSPIIGMGPGNFLLVSNAFTHNSYLAVLIEYGLVGALPWFLLLAMTAYRGVRMAFGEQDRRTWHLEVACLSAFLGLLAGGITIEIENAKFFWLIIGIVTGMAMYWSENRSLSIVKQAHVI